MTGHGRSTMHQIAFHSLRRRISLNALLVASSGRTVLARRLRRREPAVRIWLISHRAADQSDVCKSLLREQIAATFVGEPELLYALSEVRLPP
jgi:hypothetical protein